MATHSPPSYCRRLVVPQQLTGHGFPTCVLSTVFLLPKWLIGHRHKKKPKCDRNPLVTYRLKANTQGYCAGKINRTN